MKRDPLFFRFFKELPGAFFHLIGRPAADADRYTLDAIEYKETAVRLDGVFQPREPDAGPAYLWEAQFYASEKLYANLLTKIGRFLQHGDPSQDWVAVVIYPTRGTEQKNIVPYRCLLESDQLVRIFLDELPPPLPEMFELGVLELIAAKPDAALAKAQSLVPQVMASARPEHYRRLVIQFIETVILCQFPKWSREEVEKMIQVSDIRETRVFQEALEEGMEKGRVKGIEEGIEKGIEKGIERVAHRLIKLKHSVEQIAKMTGLSEAQVRKLKKKKP